MAFPGQPMLTVAGLSLQLLHPELATDLAGHLRTGAKPTPGKANNVE
jgi:hypothetical protein